MGRLASVSDVVERLEELRGGGALSSHAAGRGPSGAACDAGRRRGPAALLEQLPGPCRPSPGPSGGGRRRGTVRRRRRRVAPGLREHVPAPPARGAARRLRGLRGGALVRVGLPGQHSGRSPRWPAAARSSSPTSSTTRASSTAAGSARAERFVYRHADLEHLAWGLRKEARRGGADRHRRGLLDGRRRRAARRPARSGAPPPLPPDGRRGARDGRARSGRGRRGGRGRALRGGGRDRRHARKGARQLRRLRLRERAAGRPPDQHGAPVHLLDRPTPSRRSAPRSPPWPSSRDSRAWSSSSRATRAILREALGGHGLEVGPSRTQIVPVVVGEARRATALCERALEGGVFAQAIRPPTVPEGTSRLRLSAMANHRQDELHAAAGVIAHAARDLDIVAGGEARTGPAWRLRRAA